MRKEFLPFSKPSISEDDISAVAEVLRSGWITTGHNNAGFEKAFREYTGNRGAVALASATAGMHLALYALGIKAGDEVITPSMTWVSTVNLIALAGAKPVFADIDKNTMMITPETIEKHITEKTALIIPVHFAGAPADMDGIKALADKHGIKVIEDAAHAAGTFYKGRHVGSGSSAAIYSFHPIKNITTGEGGMLCSDDENFIEQIRQLKFHGLGVDAFDRNTQGRSPQAQVLRPGFKYNMTDISAVLGIGQLKRLDEFNRKRNTLAGKYLELLSDVDEIIPLASPEYEHKHARHLFIVRLDTGKAGISRDAFMEELKKRNIGTGLHFRAVHTQKYYLETMPEIQGTLPATEWNSDRIMSLPLFPDMNDKDIEDTVNAIKDVLAHAG